MFLFSFPKEKEERTLQTSDPRTARSEEKNQTGTLEPVESVSILRGWEVEGIVVRHLNTHHEAKLLMGECGCEVMPAFTQEVTGL